MSEKESLCTLVPDNVLKKFEIKGSVREDMLRNLRILGISELSVFPDFEGLATKALHFEADLV